MPEENDKPDTENESEAKPTITIAEKQGGAAPTTEGKPTITIAEREAGE